MLLGSSGAVHLHHQKPGACDQRQHARAEAEPQERTVDDLEPPRTPAGGGGDHVQQRREDTDEHGDAGEILPAQHHLDRGGGGRARGAGIRGGDGDCGIDAEDERAARRMKIVGGNRMPGHPVEVAGEPRQLDGKPRATRRDNPQRPNRTGLRADEADAAQTARDLLVELQRDHTRSAVHRGAGGGHGAYEVGVCGGRAGQGERQAGYAQ